MQFVVYVKMEIKKWAFFQISDKANLKVTHL